jgi:hypothetical protein
MCRDIATVPRRTAGSRHAAAWNQVAAQGGSAVAGAFRIAPRIAGDGGASDSNERLASDFMP